MLGSSSGFGVNPFGIEELPSPESSGIDHIVVVTMENRSFDHFFGWFLTPTANRPASPS